tara:strand:+ start:337 stop:477 length:141 start_codon:yes stop_codon:yes gene_type:complete
MTHEWKHPNYYKRLKELLKKDNSSPQEQDQEEQEEEKIQDKKDTSF